MKTALEKLKELREHDSSIVAIARDEDGSVFYFSSIIPIIKNLDSCWSNGHYMGIGYFELYDEVEFPSSDWTKCIVTYKDLKNYEIETITISKSEYDKLSACESKLNEIMKILEK